MRNFRITEQITLRNESITRYLNDVSKIPLMTADEAHEVEVKAATGDRDAIDRLVEANLRFVISVAKMYQGGSATRFADLINEGNIGLIEAASDFDPTTGFKFISYAVWHIRNNMFKYLTNYSRHIRIPMSKVRALKKIDEIESNLIGVLGRTPSLDEVLEVYSDWHLSEKGKIVKLDGLKLAMNVNHRITSLESPANESDENSLSPIHVINGDLDGADYLATSNNTLKALLPYVNKLPSDVDREIILMRFGFINGGETASFVEIGSNLGYSAEHIRQRYKSSIRKLQSSIRLDNVTLENFI